jgi:hypothetical protein
MLRFPLSPSVSMKVNTYTKDTVALIDLNQKNGMTSRCSFDHFVGKNKQQRRDARRSTVVSVVRVRNGRSAGALGLFLPGF